MIVDKALIICFGIYDATGRAVSNLFGQVERYSLCPLGEYDK